MEEFFDPFEDRYEDKFSFVIPEEYIYKLSKKGSQRREKQDKKAEKIRCQVCRGIINKLSSLYCISCNFLACYVCYQKYQDHDDARNQKFFCDCSEDKLKGKKLSNYHYKMEFDRLGVFQNVFEDEGTTKLGILDFSEVVFRCKFRDCTQKLKYDEMIDATFHNDCDYRPYKCRKCKTVVPKILMREHRYQNCRAVFKQCDYCHNDVKEQNLKNHLQNCIKNTTTGSGQMDQNAKKIDESFSPQDQEDYLSTVVSKGKNIVQKNEDLKIEESFAFPHQNNGNLLQKSDQLQGKLFCSPKTFKESTFPSLLGQKHFYDQRFHIDSPKRDLCKKCKHVQCVQGDDRCKECLRYETQFKRQKRSDNGLLGHSYDSDVDPSMSSPSSSSKTGSVEISMILTAAQREAKYKTQNEVLIKEKQTLQNQNEALNAKVNELEQTQDEASKGYMHDIDLLKSILKNKEETIQQLNSTLKYKRQESTPCKAVVPLVPKQNFLQNHQNNPCVKCQPDQVDLLGLNVVFCKACINKQIKQGEQFILFLQCETCNDAVGVKFKCGCQGRNQFHLQSQFKDTKYTENVVQPPKPIQMIEPRIIPKSLPNEEVKLLINKDWVQIRESLNVQHDKVVVLQQESGDRNCIPNGLINRQNQWQLQSQHQIKPLLKDSNRNLNTDGQINNQRVTRDYDVGGDNDFFQKIRNSHIMAESSRPNQDHQDHLDIQENEPCFQHLLREISDQHDKIQNQENNWQKGQEGPSKGLSSLNDQLDAHSSQSNNSKSNQVSSSPNHSNSMFKQAQQQAQNQDSNSQQYEVSAFAEYFQ